MTVYRDFQPLYFFGLTHTMWTPYEQAKTSSRTFFNMAKIFDHEVQNSRVHVANDYGDPPFLRRVCLCNLPFSNVQILLLDM